VLGSTCSLAVGAQTHPSDGLLRRFHRASRVIPTRGVIRSILRAAAVLPCVTKSAPCRPVAGGSPFLTRRGSRACSDAPRTQANAAGQDRALYVKSGCRAGDAAERGRLCQKPRTLITTWSDCRTEPKSAPEQRESQEQKQGTAIGAALVVQLPGLGPMREPLKALGSLDSIASKLRTRRRNRALGLRKATLRLRVHVQTVGLNAETKKRTGIGPEGRFLLTFLFIGLVGLC
jgi:hypothetical protein